MITSVYLISILQNLHNLASMVLFVGGCVLAFLIIFATTERKGLSDSTKTYLTYMAVVFLVALTIFCLTPANFKLDLDRQYIQKNSELQSEILELKQQLNKYEYGVR